MKSEMLFNFEISNFLIISTINSSKFSIEIALE